MATLTLVRHGQTQGSWDDRDRLSPTGERQARALGQAWARAGIRPDLVFMGPAQRHLRTWQIACESLREVGLPVPEAVTLEGLDEYAPGPLVAALPALAERNEDVRALVDAAREGNAPLYRVLLPLGRAWARGELDGDGVEPFGAFVNRVLHALGQMMKEAPRGSNVAAFTSAGPIGSLVAHALGAPHEKAFELTLSVFNTSQSQWLFSAGGRLTLHGFNAVDHLDEPSLRTYR